MVLKYIVVLAIATTALVKCQGFGQQPQFNYRSEMQQPDVSSDGNKLLDNWMSLVQPAYNYAQKQVGSAYPAEVISTRFLELPQMPPLITDIIRSIIETAIQFFKSTVLPFIMKLLAP